MAECFAYYGDPETSETEIFVQLFDQFFDCLNIRSLSEWRLKGKPNLKPYNYNSNYRHVVQCGDEAIPFIHCAFC